MSVAALLLATALCIGADGRHRLRVSTRTRRRAAPLRPDALSAAFTLDVLSACLRSGTAVAAGAAAAAVSAPPELARPLTRAAHLLALGADASVAWADDDSDPRAQALLRMARRSAASGTALAQGVSELATQFRDDAADAARAASERASVLIAAPLGLCYLPAFVCLGIVPVVAGLAGDVLRSGVL